MAYIVERKDRFFVVDYDGIDPITGRERRRWRLAGHTRDAAEALVDRLDRERDNTRRDPSTLGGFLVDVGIDVPAADERSDATWKLDLGLRPHLLGQEQLESIVAEP